MANDIQKYDDGQNRSVGTFDEFFDSMFNAWGLKTAKIPPVDIEETKDGYVISANMPGLGENDVNVYVEKHVLNIESLKNTDESRNEEKDGRKYLVKERSVSQFQRSFTLPQDADAEKITASFKDGLLVLTIPKKAQALPRKISINSEK